MHRFTITSLFVALGAVVASTQAGPTINPFPNNLPLLDSRGTMSAEASIRRVVPAAAAAPQPVLLQTYRVTGGQVAEAVRIARQRGFRHTVLPINANSRCSLEDQANAVRFVMNGRGVLQLQPVPQCRIRLFEGRLLQPNWHLKSAAFSDVGQARARWVLEQRLKPSGRDPSFVVYGQLTMPERAVPGAVLPWVGDAARAMTELVFDGPVGKTWRNAFEP